jgi:hypothetical protein
MVAFAAVIGGLSLMCLLYARLTAGAFVLLPIRSNLVAERCLWLVLLSAAAWITGKSIWRLLVEARQSSLSIAVGTVVAVACVCGTALIVHSIDPGNEPKTMRQLPRAIAGALCMLALMVITQRPKDRNVQPRAGCRQLLTYAIRRLGFLWRLV